MSQSSSRINTALIDFPKIYMYCCLGVERYRSLKLSLGPIILLNTCEVLKQQQSQLIVIILFHCSAFTRFAKL